MKSLKSWSVLLLLMFVVQGCTSDTTPFEELDKARIVNITMEPPSVVVTESSLEISGVTIDPVTVVSLSIRHHDPEFRTPTIHWYAGLSLDAGFVEDIAKQSWAVPADIVSSEFLYLGSGAAITVPVPDLPITDFPDDFSVDVVQLPVGAVLVFEDEELKAFTQMRVIVPDLLERSLIFNEDAVPTAAELDAAILARYNRNPVVEGLSLSFVPVTAPYPQDAMEDLVARQELLEQSTQFASEMSAESGLRIRASIVDVDEEKGIERGQSGYNRVEQSLLRPFGQGFGLTLTSTDWVPVEFSQSSIFEEPSLDWLDPDLVTLHGVIIDRQGGTAHYALDVDMGVDPVDVAQGAEGSVLLADGYRLLWANVDQLELLSFLQSATAPIAVTANIWHAAAPPLGVTAVIQGAAPIDAVTDAISLDRFDADTIWRGTLTGQTTHITGTVVRTWLP